MEPNAQFNHHGGGEDIHVIDEIERSQDLFKLAKPAFWGVSASFTSHNLQSYCCDHESQAYEVPSGSVTLPVPVSGCYNQNWAQVYRNYSGRSQIRTWITGYILIYSYVEDLFPWKTL